jgi:hypothetical protein
MQSWYLVPECTHRHGVWLALHHLIPWRWESIVTTTQPLLLPFAQHCLSQYWSCTANSYTILNMHVTYSLKICKVKKGKLREPAPKCHRVLRWAGHQKVTMECLDEFAVTALSTLPRDARQFTFSPGGN